MYVGFLTKGNNPNDLCLPCCFNNWNTKILKSRRKDCMNEDNEEKEEKKEKNTETPGIDRCNDIIETVLNGLFAGLRVAL